MKTISFVVKIYLKCSLRENDPLKGSLVEKGKPWKESVMRYIWNFNSICYSGERIGGGCLCP